MNTPYSQATLPDDACTHVVKTFRGDVCVDSVPFIYDGNNIVAYALDLLKTYGKLGNRIEITTI